MGSGGHLCICVRTVGLGWQWVLSYTVGHIHGLGRFLSVLPCMCIFGALCDPNWRYYCKKPMVAWTAIFSHNVNMIPYVEAKAASSSSFLFLGCIPRLRSAEESAVRSLHTRHLF